MYKIGTFSTITSLTVKALRYYHDEGILVPSEIDEMTGYRIYTKDQVAIGNAIRLLRECTFTVKEIKEILKNSDCLEDLPYFMDEKMTTIDQEVRRLEEVKQKLINEKEKKEVVRQMNDYKVNEKTVDEVQAITMRYQGRYDGIGGYIGQLYKASKGQVKDNVFCLYHDNGKKEIADIEVCLPVKKEIKTPEGIVYKVLKGQSGVAVTHMGSYDGIGSAYQAVADYGNDHNLEFVVPSREAYIKGPGMIFKGNPNKYVTEIFMPIK